MRDRDLLPTLKFRFTDAADVAIYGDDWFTYDERAIVKKPARYLIAIEDETGMAMPQMMNEMRRSSVLGDLCGAWIGVRETDPKLAGPFDDFTPIVMLMEWDKGPAPRDVEVGKSETGEMTPPDSIGDLPDQSTPLVTLQTLPAVESPN